MDLDRYKGRGFEYTIKKKGSDTAPGSNFQTGKISVFIAEMSGMRPASDHFGNII
jgi:hypothetical protein